MIGNNSEDPAGKRKARKGLTVLWNRKGVDVGSWKAVDKET